ncbi:MAG: amidase, partial [Steroidobacteraceae bacterium]|nr:amidase [Steroidobacteraceae bacterium]MDW8259777.1 amidase [Gammaproteobacteria bacterium]
MNRSARDAAPIDLTADATSLSGALQAGAVSSAALTAQCLAHIDAQDPLLGLFTHVAHDEALAAARAADDRRARGRALGPLDGLPVALKANMAVRGWPLTAGLKFRAAERAEADAFVVARLRAAGAVLLGLTNMDEGALGAEGTNPWYRTTHNPLRPLYCAGGSSSGAAAAVAIGACAFALGTDTIGSIRIPAAFCGCVGLKPSFGRLSTRGIVPVHLRFDHVGPLTRTVRDLALVLPLLEGFDAQSSVSVPYADPAAPAVAPVTRRIGYGVGFGAVGVTDAVIADYNRALAALRALGHTLVPV